MKLKNIFEQVLKELDGQDTQTVPPVSTATQPNQQPGNKILDFSRKQFTVSVFDSEKKMIFTPKKGSLRPTNLRIMINQLKNNFKVSNVKALSDGVFEVVFSPTENIGVITDFIQRFVEKSK